ncbi:MAG: FliA/WhiG family RNA polymerase sigma factor [Nitrospiraceae bacterium]|nr:FliA/WhiG family RNA polymerase sigma factor [Nitrospiraceae bacterium]
MRAETFYKQKKMSEQEKEQLVREFLPFIKYTAYRLAWRLPNHLTVDDLISVGAMGLLDALQRYEQGRVKLKTFVEFRIKGAMLDEIRAYDWMPKSVKKKIDLVKKSHSKLEKELGRVPEESEIAGDLGISLDEYYEILQNSNNSSILRLEDFRGGEDASMDALECIRDPNAKNPLECLIDSSQKQMLADAINRIPEKEKMVLSLYYWEELTMKEISQVLDLTEGRVSQLHKQALLRLKSELQSGVSPKD